MAAALQRSLSACRPLAASSHAFRAIQARGVVAPPFQYEQLFDTHANEVPTKFRKLASDGVSTCTLPSGEKLLKVESEVLEGLSHQAIVDIQHLFRPAHLQQLSNILKDPEASSNDRFVALELLKNACVSAGKVMPSCQDTGTASIMAKRGGLVLTDGRDEEFISKGVYRAYTEGYLRYSQVAPQSMFEEVNTRTNLPAQIDMMSQTGSSYDFLYVAKGGGSANKTQLLQKTKGTLNEKAFTEFLTEQITNLGTAACPPYHLAVVVGGLSTDLNLKTVKLASCKYLDGLPTSGSKKGRAFRDIEWEAKTLKLAQDLGIGAQFGGKYFLHDVRMIRLPRHGASCPIGIGVSCSADRQAKAKITEEGIFLEELETEPAKYLPDVRETALEQGGEIVKVNLNNPMEENLKLMSQYPVKTRLALTGTIIVARDIAHAKMQEMIDSGKGLPEYIKKYPVYYAGPAKTPAGMPSGSFGPTTSGRMDQYVDSFQSRQGSMIMIGKGNRSKSVTDSCKKHGGFYLGSIGGVAATLSSNSIKKVEVLDMEELGMEAVWKIEVEDFPAFVVVDDKGNDFFKKWSKEAAKEPEQDSFFEETKGFFFGLDSDQNGVLSTEELAKGLGMSLAEAKTLVDTFDVDKDGVIDVKEFELMLIKNESMKNHLLQM
mmetsp:Transcript_731/g.1293  ORF Transcript_731/g.1293 Transcript_731/m.1293 type:complete len:658 (+) Transcript_731:66-2039(+)|eukprot:CAMPEP_0197665168 /NCGR_PEP_ID=MMETSP1338-20131121/59067_1 /TAXON_ID=43686 ORGANISM="Pelagodinium beii, Strain RCC1491" /NCGR_SAMPLE_ID=MMETSP1338 /ASSEMBLY_ACC=CAM_ASM_000754 /LENGTH=657 /DNA_ID=CAMNT_0043243933 /DNA_START=53 /DNA_END=2026 /DNA_ORIENTATION=-